MYYQINKYKKIYTTKNVARKTTQNDDGYILRKFKQNVIQTLRSVAKKLKEGEEIDISERTVHKRIKEADFGTYVSRVIPLITLRIK